MAEATTAPKAVTEHQNTNGSAKAERKPRKKAEGLGIAFRLTDSNEITKLQEMAAKERRTPENYVSLLLYKHLMGHAPIKNGSE